MDNILVLGDIMVDTRINSTTSRLASEGPVPVCKEYSREHRLGGSGLITMNLASLGRSVTPVAVVGRDEMGEQILDNLVREGIRSDGIFRVTDRVTTQKTRLFSGEYLISRIDKEESNFIDIETENRIIEFILQILPSCCAVLIIDYRKGLITDNIINVIRENTENSNIIVIADPKHSIQRFQGFHTLKLNYTEFLSEIGLESAQMQIESQIKQNCIKNKLQRIFVTMADDGIISYDSKQDTIVKKRGNKVNAINCVGAGDVVIAVITALTLDNIPHDEICKISEYIGRLSVQSSNFLTSGEDILKYLKAEKKVDNFEKLKFIISTIRRLGKTIVFTNGCFDVFHHAHLSNLERSKTLANVLMVGVNTDESIRKLKGNERPINPLEFRVKILSWIPEVDFILPFDTDTPENLISIIRPDVLTKGSDYTKEQIKGAQYSDRVEILKSISTCSSTNIINSYNLVPFSRSDEYPSNSPHRLDPQIITKGWGFENVIVNNEKYCGKILHFDTGGQSSLHFHGHKDETWYVLRGELEFTWMEKQTGLIVKETLLEGQAIRIPPYLPHQLSSRKSSDIMEISTQHFDEDTYRLSEGDTQRK